MEEEKAPQIMAVTIRAFAFLLLVPAALAAGLATQTWTYADAAACTAGEPHDAVKKVLYDLCNRAGWPAEMEFLIGDHRLLDVKFVSPQHGHEGIDVSGANPAAASVQVQAMRTTMHAADLRNRQKIAKYAAPCDRLGIKFTPAVFETTGALHKDLVALIKRICTDVAFVNGEQFEECLQGAMQEVNYAIHIGNAKVFRHNALNAHVENQRGLPRVRARQRQTARDRGYRQPGRLWETGQRAESGRSNQAAAEADALLNALAGARLSTAGVPPAAVPPATVPRRRGTCRACCRSDPCCRGPRRTRSRCRHPRRSYPCHPCCRPGRGSKANLRERRRRGGARSSLGADRRGVGRVQRRASAPPAVHPLRARMRGKRQPQR